MAKTRKVGRMRMRSIALVCALLAVATLPAVGEEKAKAEKAEGDVIAPADGEGDGAEGEAPAEPEGEMLPHKVGPQLVELGSGVQIELPAGFILFERAEAQQIL